MLLFRVLDRGIGFVSTLFLARLLSPDDFGVVAMGTATLGLVELLGAFNFELFLVQKQDLERHHFDTAWTLNVIGGTAFCAILLAAAPWLTDFFHQPHLDAIVSWFAISALVLSLQNSRFVMLRREFQFRREFLFLAARRVIVFAVALAAAFMLRDYRALLIGIFLHRALGTLVSYAAVPFNPRFCLWGAREMIGFSKWFVLDNAIHFLMLRFPDFILGKLLGSHAVGSYSVAFEIAQLPTTELLAPINRAVYPGLARLKQDIAPLRSAFLRIGSVMILIASPAALGIAAVSDLFIELLLGPTWSEAGPLTRILAVSGLLNAPVALIGYVYIVLGKSRITAILNGVYVLLLGPSAIVAAHWGLEAVALAHLLCNLALLPIHYGLAVKILAIRWRDLAAGLWRPCLASVSMYFVVAEASRQLQTTGYSTAQCLLGAVAVGAVFYVGLVGTAWKIAGLPDGAERLVGTYLRKREF